MRAIRRGWILGFVYLAPIVLGLACNLIELPMYLFGPDDKIPAGMKQLASKDKQIKVLIWSWAPREIRASLEMPNPDRRIAERLNWHLKEDFAQNKEKVTLITPAKVDEYRRGHEDIDPRDAGKHFDVDYVIYLELEKFSVTVPGSYDEVLKGVAGLRVTLHNLKDSDDTAPMERFEYSYPEDAVGGMGIVDDSSSKPAFCDKFVDTVGRKLAWKFTAHLQEDDNDLHR